MAIRHPYKVPQTLSKSIFRANDIRGIVEENLTPDVLYALGLAIGSEAEARGQKRLVIARDGRLSGPSLLEALTQGLLETGRELIDIGLVPTPVLYYATYALGTHSGVMLTGSHNPSNYNGIKMVLNDNTLTEADINSLYQRIVSRNFIQGTGSIEKHDLESQYIERIASDIHLARPLKIIIDAGNGATGKIAPALFRRLGCEVIELFCEIDGRFPNHHPDPSDTQNLRDLQQRVIAENADLGLAFDGDGDRLGVITNQAENIWPDRQMMLFAQDVLARTPGAKIIFDVKCTRDLPNMIRKNGGEPLMWKTGHSLIKSKMRAEQAPLAGEMSGHIFFKERWYGFDDGMYAAARLIEILSKDARSTSTIFSEFPDNVNTPELKLPMADDTKVHFMQKFIDSVTFENCAINTIDGLRLDFADGWGLVRQSNTSPYLTLRFEADDTASLQRIQALFREKLLAVDNTLTLPF